MVLFDTSSGAGILLRGSAPAGAPPPGGELRAPGQASPQPPKRRGLASWLTGLAGRLIAAALRPYGAHVQCPGCGAPADRFAVPTAHAERSYPPVTEYQCTLCSRTWREIASLDHWES